MTYSFILSYLFFSRSIVRTNRERYLKIIIISLSYILDISNPSFQTEPGGEGYFDTTIKMEGEIINIIVVLPSTAPIRIPFCPHDQTRTAYQKGINRSLSSKVVKNATVNVIQFGPVSSVFIIYLWVPIGPSIVQFKAWSKIKVKSNPSTHSGNRFSIG